MRAHTATVLDTPTGEARPPSRPFPATAGRPVSLLVHELERAYWGELAAPRYRAAQRLLQALSRHPGMKHNGTGMATVFQLSGLASYSTKWTAQGLRDLEHLGLLEWTRGTVIRGERVPSYFRLNRRLLADLINAARGMRREAERLATELFRGRQRTMRSTSLPRYRYKRRSPQVEVASTLPLTGSRTTPERPPPATASRGMAAVRAALIAAKGLRT